MVFLPQGIVLQLDGAKVEMNAQKETRDVGQHDKYILRQVSVQGPPPTICQTDCPWQGWQMSNLSCSCGSSEIGHWTQEHEKTEQASNGRTHVQRHYLQPIDVVVVTHYCLREKGGKDNVGVPLTRVVVLRERTKMDVL